MEIHFGDAVRVLSTPELFLVILVEQIRLSEISGLPPGVQDILSADHFMPNPAPNALKDLQVCGKFFYSNLNENVNMSLFGESRVCVDVKSVHSVIRARDIR